MRLPLRPSRPLVVMLMALMGFSVACVNQAEVAKAMNNAVMNRAPFDLDCPREQVQTQPLGGRTYGATGCGRRATYVVQGQCFDTENRWCEAIMNSEARAQ